MSGEEFWSEGGYDNSSGGEYYFDDWNNSGSSGNQYDYDSNFETGSVTQTDGYSDWWAAFDTGVQWYRDANQGMNEYYSFSSYPAGNNPDESSYSSTSPYVKDELNKEGSSSISSMLGNKLKSAYGELDAEGKKFLWSAALGIFKSMMNSDSSKALADAHAATAKATMMNAQTNRGALALKQEQDKRAASSTGDALKMMPGLIQQPFKPVQQVDVTKRWS